MTFNCENYGCDETFVSRAGKQKHKQKCEMQGRKIQDATKDWSKSENGTFKCNKCTKSFTQLVNFYRQNKDPHVNPKPKKRTNTYKFTVCSKEFQKKSHCLRHTHS